MRHYRSALCLTSAIALTEFMMFLYVASFGFEAAAAPALRVVIALAVVFGLWTLSNIVRYLGAIWLVFSAGSVIWPLFSSNRPVWGVGLIWAVAVGTLSLAAACVLLLSKKFANEFSGLRATQPEFKKVLRRLALVVVIVVVVIATLNDLYRLVFAS